MFDQISVCRCSVSVIAAKMVYKDQVLLKGIPVEVDAVQVNNQVFVLLGSFIKTARLKTEGREDVENPEKVIRELKAASARIDLLRFGQKIPDTEAKFSYYKEWRQIATISIKDYRNWLEKQISPKARNKIRKAQKYGVTIQESEFSEALVRGIIEIFNQSPVRRGKRFWHYGKDFETVKREMSLDLKESIFVTAYWEKELIGFIKLFLTDRFAMITLILDKTAHREKAPMNGMIAKAVEVCWQRKVPYLTYTVWRRGEHGQFQESNGFERMPVPEYFVPLTFRGDLALRLGLHKGIRGLIPEGLMAWLLGLRAKWYSLKYRQKKARIASATDYAGQGSKTTV